MTDINQICDYIIFRLKSEDEIPLNNIKLQKLLYYTQAWHLAFYKGKPLFAGNFQAWIHGPVNREIFNRFNSSKYLNTEIHLTDMLDDKISEKISHKKIQHINLVLETYSVFSGLELEDMSHKETPWIEARRGYSPNQRCEVEINNTTLGEYFSKRIQ